MKRSSLSRTQSVSFKVQAPVDRVKHQLDSIKINEGWLACDLSSLKFKGLDYKTFTAVIS
jgi:hypothetical protein